MMDAILQLLSNPDAWLSLLTLTALEIVLGIDNVIFLSIVSQRLPPDQARLARRLGLTLALLGRVALLFSLTWIIGLVDPVFVIFGHEVSWRDIVLILGGAFLVAKATTEVHHSIEDVGEHVPTQSGRGLFMTVIIQILLLDIVFSLDSVLTAVGMSDHLEIMVAAVVIAMGVMLFAAEPLSRFVNKHPTVKMLALAFLLLVGVALVADGLHFHIPRGYLYAAIVFSVLVESLNLWASARRKAKRERLAALPRADVPPKH
jgi:predicted tellurium resistance membrane protein TerC